MMIIETEAVEMCPHCGGENTYPNWDVKNNGYIASCRHCGEKIMLCDECSHADDNEEKKCDWEEVCRTEHYSEGKCFRGTTHHYF